MCMIIITKPTEKQRLKSKKQIQGGVPFSSSPLQKQIYSGRYTLNKQSGGHLRKQETPGYGVVSFYGMGNFIG